MWNREVFMFHTPVCDMLLLSMMVVSTEWERELSRFIDVAPTCRFFDPF